MLTAFGGGGKWKARVISQDSKSCFFFFSLSRTECLSVAVSCRLLEAQYLALALRLKQADVYVRCLEYSKVR